MTNHTNAALALTAALPTASTLTPVITKDVNATRDVSRAVTASFVGAASADFAVVLLDEKTIEAAVSGSGVAGLTAADVLLPAIDAAAKSLGNGVLGTATVSDASALFRDTDTVIFELRDQNGIAGWFAARINVSASSAPAQFNSSKLGRISSVEMALTVEIGRTRKSIRDVLALEPGAVVELDRSAGAPADVLLNGRLIAHGEIVVVDQDYAVRITKILDTLDGAN
jgi:flagellar motor switch protein FliN/FliY